MYPSDVPSAGVIFIGLVRTPPTNNPKSNLNLPAHKEPSSQDLSAHARGADFFGCVQGQDSARNYVKYRIQCMLFLADIIFLGLGI